MLGTGQNLGVDGTGDLIIEDNNFVIVDSRTGYYQAFLLILQTRQGEYILNTDEGLNFNAFLGKKNIDLDEMTDALYEAAGQVDDFVQFNKIEFDFDRQQRKLHIYIEALFSDSAELVIDEEVQFNA